MVSNAGERKICRLKKNRHQYVRKTDLVRIVPVLVSICIALLLPVSISVPSDGSYTSISEPGPFSGGTPTRNDLQSNPIGAGDETYVLWDMIHGNQAPSQFSSLIAEIGSIGFVTDTLSSGPINASSLQGYTVLVIAQPTLTYSTNETDAIHDFVLAGGGLLVMADLDESIFNTLTDFAGIEWIVASVGMASPYQIYHPVTKGLESFQALDARAGLNITWPAIGLMEYSGGHHLLAASQIGLGKIVCMSDNDMVSNAYGAVNLGLGVNSFMWLAQATQEHDVWSHVHTWTPDLPGYERPVTLSILNTGTSLENYVIMRLYLNGQQVFVDLFPILNRSTLYTYDYAWTPSRSGIYNFTVAIDEVSGESRTEDNRHTILCQIVDFTIEILSDDDFVSQGWPGEGTIEEPYVIEGLYILTYWSKPTGIIIQNTRANFTIRNCTIIDYDDTVDGTGIDLWNVTNGVIANNTFPLGLYGVYIQNSSLCSFSNNSFIQYSEAIHVEDSTDLTIEQNLLTGTENALNLLSAEFSVVRNNTLTGNTWGLILGSQSSNVTVSWNDFNNTNNAQDSGIQNTISENYYADYGGLDNDYDGFGDTPYSIPGTTGSEDSRPLILPMKGPYITWSIAPSNVTIQYYETLYMDLEAVGYSEIAGYWVNNTAIVTIDGSGVLTNITEIPAGKYALEVRGLDHYGHYCSATFTLTVLDTDGPYWTHALTDQLVEAGEAFYYDLNATDYSGLDTWWLNDTGRFSISSAGIVTSNVLLPVGVYHITVSVNDTLGQILTGIIRIEVIDTQAPTWVAVPATVYVNYGERGILLIQAYDASGIDHYWVSDTANFSVDDEGVVTNNVSLPCGETLLEVRAYDSYGHYCSADIVIVVLDVTVPSINHPDDVTYTEGEVGNSITWQAFDDNPRSYEVVRNGVVIMQGLWNSSSEQIVVSVDDLDSGLYSYLLLVFDAGNHVMSDSVLVTVLQATSTTTTTGVAGTLDIPMMAAAGVSVASVAFAVIIIILAREGRLPRKSS
ncbi:MAG: right-handed parallel beta-helix repeat-containing protein [Candidatus Thorarchaeota archaeon]|nr:right-handed parallel beta-helix repeat-containing protein [Candidatus Thorarchaeota archaeon]